MNGKGFLVIGIILMCVGFGGVINSVATGQGETPARVVSPPVTLPSEPIVKPEPGPELSASFTIKSWDQDYYELIEKWGEFVEIYYKVENTGDLDIDYYEVYFVAECSGGKEYYDWMNGKNLGVGEATMEYYLIDVNGREVQSVRIEDWNLEHH